MIHNLAIFAVEGLLTAEVLSPLLMPLLVLVAFMALAPRMTPAVQKDATDGNRSR